MQDPDGNPQSGPLTGSPSRLNDGSWGVRVKGPASPGQIVEVRTRTGKKWESEVEAVLWTGEDRHEGGTVSLCRMVGDRGASSDTSRAPHPLADSGREVARLASSLASRKDERTQRQLLDAIWRLCEQVGVNVEFSSTGAGAPSTAPPADDAPPPDDDDLPF